jgi:hypothetical protein
MRTKPMRRSLITAGLLLGGVALAACGSSGPGVQARQAGDTTTTTTTTTAPPTTAPSTTEAPTTSAPRAAAAAADPPCTAEALEAAYTSSFGPLPSGTGLKPQKCLAGWATSSQTHGFDPPNFALYRAEGDHWVALSRGGGQICAGHGVPPEVAPQIGCDS